jgi:TonB family protein
MFRVKGSGERGTTFGVPRELRAGEILTLRVSGLGETQRLRLHRCGPGCQTAFTVATWEASQLSGDVVLAITIAEAGRHYLWIEDYSEPGRPIGRSLGASATWEEQTLILDFGNGLEVIAGPVVDVPAASSPVASESVEGLAGRCEAEVESGRYVEAIASARRWIELAETPAERGRGHHHLGVALVKLGIQEALPALDPAVRETSPSSDRIFGTFLLRQAVEAFRRASSEPSSVRDAALVSLADALLRLGEPADALAVLDDYQAGRQMHAGSTASKEDRQAANLRCWTEYGVRRAEERSGQAGDVLAIKGDVKAPIKIYSPMAQYTKEARKARIEGVVILQALIDEEGRVVCARSLSSLGGGLDEAAVDAVKQWRFKPATLNDQPVDVYYHVTMNFTLQ